MSLWISSGAFKTKNLEQMLCCARMHGLTNVELSSGMGYHPETQRLLNEEIKSGTQNFLVHNYFPAPNDSFVLNIASLDPEGLNKTRSFGAQAIKLAAKLGAPFYSIHAGFAANLKPEHLGRPGHLADALNADDIDRDRAYEVMIETTRQLSAQAADYGLNLLVENNVISPVFLKKLPINPLLLTEAHEILQFFKDVDRPNVGLLMDVAHTRVSATAQGWSAELFVELVQDHVSCLHLSDNDGLRDNNQPINRESWFLPFIKEFNNCEIVVEVYDLEPEEMHQQLSLVQDNLNL